MRFRGNTEGVYRVKINIKAALLSAFVFPGLGQIYKGCKARGFIIILAVNILFFVLFALILRDIYMLAVSGSFSPTANPATTARHIIGETPGLNPLMWTLLCVWLYGIADALFAGTGKQK